MSAYCCIKLDFLLTLIIPKLVPSPKVGIICKDKVTANAFLKSLRLSYHSLTLEGSLSIMNCKVCWFSDEQVAASFPVSKALKIPVVYKFKMQIWNSVLTFITMGNMLVFQKDVNNGRFRRGLQFISGQYLTNRLVGLKSHMGTN